MWSTGSLTRPSYKSTQVLQDLPAAGYHHETAETAKQAMTWDGRPETPQQLQPYKHYARQDPGTITKHFGTAHDRVLEGPFGSKTKASKDSAADCTHCYPDSATGRWQLARKEGIYASNRREPLGQTFTRGYNIPEGLGTERAFGRSLNSRDQEGINSTRHIIFPPARPTAAEEAAKEHELYVRTHGSFAAGEQRNRNYTWQQLGIDPAQHRFGWVDRRGNALNVTQVLQPQLDPGSKLNTSVVSKVYESHKLTQGEELGKPRRLGARMAPGPEGQDPVFGKASQRGNEPGAAELIRGWYTPEEQAPDPDLGKSLHEGFRNPTGPNMRAGGIPGVRLDIPAPANPSVANTMNYGNEPSVQQLLAAPACAELGVTAEDLLKLRSPEELARLMSIAGKPLLEEEVAAAVELGAELDGLPGHSRCSLDAFLKARRHIMAHEAGL